jgi:hypothetical protein
MEDLSAFSAKPRLRLLLDRRQGRAPQPQSKDRPESPDLVSAFATESS